MNARQGFIGQSVERREDSRFLTGKGQYTDDLAPLQGQTHGFFLRSPSAHARITSIDTSAAAKAPGVVGILTGDHFALSVASKIFLYGEETAIVFASKLLKRPSFAQVVADKLGIPMDDISIEHGDTAKVLFGMGTYGSRSLAVGGTAIVKAVDKVIAKGKKIAAHLPEAADTDIVFENGEFKVAGTDKKVPFAAVSLTAYVPHNVPHDKLEPGLNENAFYDPSNFTDPAGTCICEVEVDPATGHTRIDRMTACDDFGNIVNPMIVEGQVHGGLAQGIGQALLEHGVYDTETGQLLPGSCMDYAMPRADDLPSFTVETAKGTPCTHNPLGVKGCGEAGAIGSPPAVINAICHALGIKDVPMPATPYTVWKAVQAAGH